MNTRETNIQDAISDFVETHGRLPKLCRLQKNPSEVAEMLGFDVTIGRIDTKTAGIFMAAEEADTGFHDIWIDPQITGFERVALLWHEIAHGLDFTEHDGLACRTKVLAGRHSTRLACLLKSATHLFAAEEVLDLAAEDYSHGLVLSGDWRIKYRPDECESHARYRESAEELFAWALAISVLNPRLIAVVLPTLLEEICAIIDVELKTVLPDEAVESITLPMRKALTDPRVATRARNQASFARQMRELIAGTGGAACA